MALSAAKKPSWTELGSRAVDAGDLARAKECFEKAVSEQKGNPQSRFHLAVVLEALGEFGPAAEQLTRALRLNPDFHDAARRLGSIVGRRVLPADIQLDPIGLKACLRNEVINRDQVAEVAVYFLARSGSLAQALQLGRDIGWMDAARALVTKRNAPLVRDDLFLKAIADNIVRMPDLESLLTAVRAVLLLETPAERFQDRALLEFVIALSRHCEVNEYVYAVRAEEAARINAVNFDTLFDGDAAAGVRLALVSLYRPISQVVALDTADEKLARIKPGGVRGEVITHLAARRQEQQIAQSLRSVASPAGEVSRAVSAQYSAHPYPRWGSLGLLLKPGDWRNGMARHFPASERLAFMDAPFDLLVAGCGTGLQAVAAAGVYGPNARVTAVDISRPSLAYGKRMADKFGVKNIEFLEGDIGALSASTEFAGRFHVIECVGVLHHMADTFAGWRKLLECLHGDGVMLVGLYSAIARASWLKYREDPAYPGAGCDDDALRRFRQNLLTRSDDELGPEFRGIRDLYTASSFRDFLLHVNEHVHTLPEIGKFLSDEGLAFRGFHGGHGFGELLSAYPDEVWPGHLQRWSELEQSRPKLFSNMYRFWVERSVQTGQ